MFPVPLVTSTTFLTSTSFWDVILLYHNRPHLINRKLLAASQILFYKVKFHSDSISDISELFTHTAILSEMRRLKKVTKENISEKFLKEFFEYHDKNVILTPTDVNNFGEEYDGVFVSVRILIPRNRSTECVEIVILDKDKNTVTFLAVNEKNSYPVAPPFPYNIELTSSTNLRVNLQNFGEADTSHAEWIANKLFPRLLKWTESDVELSSILGSLSLISVDQYSNTYVNLKTKYGHDLVKVWPNKTNTDPQKYVFEDLAIASYLICLWNKYDKDSINFIDCGCGNGLLVYILNQEGYKGYGLDIRRRPVWDIYPKETRLEVEIVTPLSVFPDTTWIIGNHSDELTPWIPIIAMKSSPLTNIFVIPCCPYDFSGQKYSRINTSVSQYSDYFSYIENIYNMCGFDTQTDKLRIPSTKRKCLVGVSRNLTVDELTSINNEIDRFINSRLSSCNFKPKSNVETVRNCTQLNRDVVQKLVFTCVGALLAEKNYIKKANGEEWNKGGNLSILELSKHLKKEDLKQLKEQCGGLQTLLRNHRYLFEFQQCKVSLRQPPLLSTETIKYKNKPCWFFKNHTDGCLHSSENCSYNHAE